VRYMPPFDVIKRSVEISNVKGVPRVGASYEQFVQVIKMLLAGIEVNEEWYAATYPDIGQAVRDGGLASGRRHFVDDGYFEGRQPFPVRVDETWYLQQYPDVAEGVRAGQIESAQAHFDKDGYQEGRLPFAI
jgi:hypothetical protein